MIRLRAVMVKELRQIRRDPFSLGMLIVLPAFMLVLYGFALNFDVRHVRLAVQDRDKSARSRELVAAFTNSTYFDQVATPPPGERPRGAHRAARGARGARDPRGLRVATLAERPRRAGAAPARRRRLHHRLDRARLRARARRRGEPRHSSRTRSRPRAASRVVPLRLEPRVLFNPELESTQFLVPGLIGFLLMLTAVLSTALSVVREKERGTMEQLRHGAAAHARS